MTATCFSILRFIRTRFAQLDTDGSFLAGAKNLYVTDTNVSLAIGYNQEAGDDFTQKNGGGNICFAYLDTDKYKNLTLGLVFCDHDPEAQKLLVGGTLITEGADSIGVSLPRVGSAGNEDGVSMEGWTLNIDGSGINSSYPYVRHVFGKTRWTPTDKTLENAPTTNAFSGVGYENTNLYDGAANDLPFTQPDQWSSLYTWYGDTTVPDAVCGGQLLSAAS